MSQSGRDHQAAALWIEGEIQQFAESVGQKNASAAATSVVTLAFLLGVITEDEYRAYRARIDKIYATYNASLVTAP